MLGVMDEGEGGKFVWFVWFIWLVSNRGRRARVARNVRRGDGWSGLSRLSGVYFLSSRPSRQSRANTDIRFTGIESAADHRYRSRVPRRRIAPSPARHVLVGLAREGGGADFAGLATLNEFDFTFVCKQKKTVVIYRMT